MTLADIRERAYRMLGVDPTAPVFWTDAQMNRYINDAYIDVCRRTRAKEVRFTVALTSTGEVTLPDYIGPIFRVMYDGYRINPASTWEMDRIDPGWEDRSGFISHYVIDARDDRKLRLYKKPVSANPGTFTSEYGVLAGFTGGDDTYTFAADTTLASPSWLIGKPYTKGSRVTGYQGVEYRCILAHTSSIRTYPGFLAGWASYWVNAKDDGLLVSLSSSSQDFMLDLEYGVLVDVDLDEKPLEIWAVKYPTRMTLDTESPELPAHVHIALAFDAASRALMRRGDHYNPALSEAYGALAQDHYRFLRSLVDNRAPEATEVVGTRATTTRYVVDPSDQVITES